MASYFQFCNDLRQQEKVMEQKIGVAYKHLVKGQVQPQLEHLYRGLAEKQIPDTSQQENLLQMISGSVQRFVQYVGMTMKDAVQRAAWLAVQFVRDSLPGKQAEPPFLTRDDSSVFHAMQDAEKRIDLLLTILPLETVHGVGQALRRGFLLERTTNQIAGEIAQALALPRWHAEMIASSELYRVFREVTINMLRANGGVSHWRWIARLDRRTCAACIALHGTLHPVSEHMQSHPRCGCFALPEMDTNRAFLTGVEWFNQQDADVQRAILGNAKYKAWKQHKFSLLGIVGHSHDRGMYEKSLKELVKGV